MPKASCRRKNEVPVARRVVDGSPSPEGKAACVAAHWKHGRRSKAYVETRKQIWAELRRLESHETAGLID